MKNFVLLQLLLLLSIIVSAQEINGNLLKSSLKFLASDELKGREVLTTENEIAAKYIATRFEEFGLLPCIDGNYKIPFQYKGQTGNNVCAMKPGKSEEILIVSAHFDHIGVSESMDNDKSKDLINNGADDNASGTAAVIAIADYLKNKPTNKTIWFVGFNAEEVGLNGSKQMTENKEVQKHLNKVVAVFNLEMLGTISDFGENTVFMTGDKYSDLDELINGYSLADFKVEKDAYPTAKLFYRSDNASFAAKNIVAHSFSTAGEASAKYYHQPNDETENLNFDNLVKVTTGLAKAIELMTNSNQTPRYNELFYNK